MTLAEARESDKLFLTCDDVAKIMGCGAQSIRVQAETQPELIGFPISIIGRRIRIPRVPFLRFLGEEKNE